MSIDQVPCPPPGVASAPAAASLVPFPVASMRSRAAAAVDRPAPAPRRRLRRWLALLAAISALLALAWFFRAPLLTGFARAWVVDDPLAPADAIVIPGGRPDLRAVAAARIYQQGYAPRILYMDVKAGPSVELGIVPSERDQTRRLLLTNGVPESALTAIGDSVANTHDESLAVRDWLARTGLHSVIIVTDLSHTRRARWIFRKELAAKTQVRVHAIQPKEYAATNWWQREDGLIAFQNEVLKDVYYHLKY